MSAKPIRSLVAALLGGILAAAGVLAVAPSQTKTVTRTVAASAGARATAPVAAQTGVLTPRQIYEQDAPSVVAIEATSDTASQNEGAFGGFFGGGAATQPTEDTGSGIVLTKSGLILTNNHVVSGASTITVQVGGSSAPVRPATLVGVSANNDLAIIKISPTGLNLAPLTFADSDAVQIGDPAYAIGNPFGLDQTLTTGVVSALNRQIQSPNNATISGVIQTDAALNPGNSGGPLLNSAGQVIGVNSQIESGSSTLGSSGGNTGIGFAVSSNTAKAVIAQITGPVAPAGTPAKT